MEDELRMSRKERRRLVEMKLVSEGRLSLLHASERAGLSYRQMKRIWKRYREEGEAGLVHRSRGCRSNRSKSEVRSRLEVLRRMFLIKWKNL